MKWHSFGFFLVGFPAGINITCMIMLIKAKGIIAKRTKSFPLLYSIVSWLEKQLKDYKQMMKIIELQLKNNKLHFVF